MAITISVLGLIILLLVLFVLFRKKGQPAIKTATMQLKETSEFHSVAIKPGTRACDAAKQMSGQRILSKEVPGLPLPDCDLAQCNCKFIHYSDRRKANARRSPFASGVSGDTGKHLQEQRESREDRRSDSRDEEF